MKWEVLGKSKTKNIITTLLENRGIKTEKEKKEFFKPTPPEKLMLKALGISQLEIRKAVKRIKKALKEKEAVIVYGDYDADGICGTAILWETLYHLGLNVLPYLPERFSEGYGLNAESVQKLKAKNEKLKLIITVDNGIVAYQGIKKAKELGIDVIITDHHQVGKTKPRAYSIVHTTKISGAAVAWILSQQFRKDEAGLELATIGTIADQLPLIGLNRSFVKHGLEKLNQTKRIGLQALIKEAGLVSKNLGVYEVGFLLAPRINAMGRLVHAIDSLRLLCLKTSRKAVELARLLNKTNLERQRIVDEVVIHAFRQTQGKPEKGIIVVASESYHEGVIGLAAGKLVDEFYRPAIVFAKKTEISKASARSVSGFNIIEAIRKLEYLYIEGGGHPMAAGFSIETAKIKEFTKQINELTKNELTDDLLQKKLKIDLELDFNQLNWQFYDKLKEFEPTGLGNFTPLFVTYGVNVLNAKTVGREGSHLKLKLEKDGANFDAIAFGFGSLLPELTPDCKVDVVYSIEENIWNDHKSLQLKIKDLKIN